MAYYPAPTGGGGGGGLAQAISLWNQFLGPGAEDRKLRNQRDLAAEERAQAEELRAQGRDVRSQASNELAMRQGEQQFEIGGQTLAQNSREAARSKGTAAIGQVPALPDIPFFPGVGEAWNDTAQEMKQTPFAELTQRGQGVASAAPQSAFPDLNELDIAPAWDAAVGVRTGSKGSVPVGSSFSEGKLTTSFKPAAALQAEAAAKQGESQGKLDETNRKAAEQMLQRFNSEPVVQHFGKASSSYEGLRRAVESSRTKPSGANDIAIVFSFMHTIEPTSTVREGEFATAENSGGIPAQVRNLYNKVVSGQRLPQEQREEFLKTADGNLAGHATVADRLRGRYLDDAQRLGVPAALFNPNSFGQGDAAPPGTPPGAGGAEKPFVVNSPEDMKAAIAAGAKSILSNGKVIPLRSGAATAASPQIGPVSPISVEPPGDTSTNLFPGLTETDPAKRALQRAVERILLPQVPVFDLRPPTFRR